VGGEAAVRQEAEAESREAAGTEGAAERGVEPEKEGEGKEMLGAGRLAAVREERGVARGEKGGDKEGVAVREAG